MSKKMENAIQLFQSGLNCSQAVMVSFCENYGVDKKTALKMACGFGGGLRSGEVCGAVSGAVMVIGLKYGNDNVEEGNSKMDCYGKTVEFMTRFRESHQTVVCRNLLGHDISTESGMKNAKEQGLFDTTCVQLIVDAIELLEEMEY